MSDQGTTGVLLSTPRGALNDECTWNIGPKDSHYLDLRRMRRPSRLRGRWLGERIDLHPGAITYDITKCLITHDVSKSVAERATG